MSDNPALAARCDYAMFLILGDSHQDHRKRAIASAECCGYAAYPSTYVPAYFWNEEELAQAYQVGWAKAQEEHLPRSRETLAAIIEAMSESANRGCGQFYELYEQNFNYAVDRWLPSLRDGELPVVQELLKSTVYQAERSGHWEYDQEENDVHFVED